jgi:hypothetical protein
MQKMDDEVQDLNSRISETRERIKNEMSELEQLRSIEKERLAELELVGKEAGEEEDPKIGGLYDWYGMVNQPLSVSSLIWVTHGQVRGLVVDPSRPAVSQVYTRRIRKRAATDIFDQPRLCIS